MGRIINPCLCFQVLYILIAISGLWQARLVLLLRFCPQTLHLLFFPLVLLTFLASHLFSQSLPMLYSLLPLSLLTLNTLYRNTVSVVFLCNNSCTLRLLLGLCGTHFNLLNLSDALLFNSPSPALSHSINWVTYLLLSCLRWNQHPTTNPRPQCSLSHHSPLRPSYLHIPLINDHCMYGLTFCLLIVKLLCLLCRSHQGIYLLTGLLVFWSSFTHLSLFCSS